MAAADNPFYVKPVNAMEALMSGYQGYDRAVTQRKEAEMDAAFKELGPMIQQGGLDNSALGRLFGLGPKAAPMITAAAQFKKAMGENDAYYGVPVYGLDQNGQPFVAAWNKKGDTKRLDFGQGSQISGGVKVIDTPQGQYVIDAKTGATPRAPLQIGQPPSAPGVPSMPQGGPPMANTQGFPTGGFPQGYRPGFVPKDNRGEAANKALGTEEGKTMADMGAKEGALKSSLSALDSLKDYAIKVKDHAGLGGITGVQGYFPNMRGSQAANAEALLTTLKSQAAFSVLQAMREASKTGGALGSITEGEINRLENSLAALDKAQDIKQFQAELAKIVVHANESKARIQAAYDQDVGRLRNPGAGRTVTPTQAQPGGVVDWQDYFR